MDGDPAARAFPRAGADDGEARRLPGGVAALEERETGPLRPHDGGGGSSRQHLQRGGGLGRVEDEVTFLHGRRGGRRRGGGPALQAVDAPHGVGEGLADGARGDGGAREGVDRAAVLLHPERGGGFPGELRGERRVAELRAEAGRFVRGEDPVGDDGAVGREARHEADVAGVAVGARAGDGVAEDLRARIVRVADEEDDVRVGGVGARHEGLDAGGHDGLGGAVRLERCDVRDGEAGEGIDDRENRRADGGDRREGQEELEHVLHRRAPKGFGCVKREMRGVKAFRMRMAKETPSGKAPWRRMSIVTSPHPQPKISLPRGVVGEVT